jgi:hypothetical protein
VVRVELTGGKSTRFTTVSTLIFIAAGLFWALIVVLQQGDPLLIWPSLASFASAGLILAKRSVEITRRVALAAALYNLTIFLYQAYSAFTLVNSTFGSFATLAAVSYLVGTVIFLFLMLGLYADSA